jgi:hypothetical protein
VKRALARLIKVVREYRYVRMARIGWAPLTETPMPYLVGKQAWRRVWGLPFLVGSAYGAVNKLFANYVLSQPMTLAAGASSTFVNTQFVKHFDDLVGMGAMALAVLMIYAIALIRWGFHVCATQVARRFIASVKRPPFRFFVVITSGYAIWFTGAGLVIVSLLELTKGHSSSSYLASLEQAYPWAFLGAAVALWYVTSAAQKRQHEGLQEMYGGSRRVLLAVNAIAIAILLALIYVTAHL